MQSRNPQGGGETTLKRPKPKLQKLSRANSESNVNGQSKSPIITTTNSPTTTKVSFNSSSIPTSNIGISNSSIKPPERRSSLGSGGIRSLRNKFQALSNGVVNKKSPPSISVPLPSSTSTTTPSNSSSKKSPKIGDGATIVPTTSKGPGPMIWKEGIGWGDGNGTKTVSSAGSSLMVRGWSDPVSSRSSSSLAESTDISEGPTGLHRPSLDSVMAANIKLQQQPTHRATNSFSSHPSPPFASTSSLTPLTIPRSNPSSTSPWAKTPVVSATSDIPVARRYSKDFERSSTEPPLSQLRATRRGSTTTIPRKPVPAPDIPERASSRISGSSFINGNSSPRITSNSQSPPPPATRFGYTRRGSLTPSISHSSPQPPASSSLASNGTPPHLRTIDPAKKDDLAYRRLSLTAPVGERKVSYRISETPEILQEEEPIMMKVRPTKEEKGKGPEIVKTKVALYQQKEVEWTKTPRYNRSGSTSGGESTADLGTAVIGGSLRNRNAQWKAPNSDLMPTRSNIDQRKVELEKEEEEDSRSVLDPNKSDGRSFRSNTTTPEQLGDNMNYWPLKHQTSQSDIGYSNQSSRDPLRDVERYTRPDSNISRHTFGSPGGPQEFTTPPPSPPPPPSLSVLYSKPIPLTPPRSIRRTHSGTSSLDNSNFRALGRIGEHSGSSSPLRRRATDGKNWSGSRTVEAAEDNRLRSSQMQILRSQQSISTVGWSEPYLDDAEIDADSNLGEYLTPSAERFAKEEYRRRTKESPLDDLINGLGGRRASEGTLRLDSSLGHSTMIGFYARNHEEDDYSPLEEVISPTFSPTTTIVPKLHHINSHSAPTLHASSITPTPGYTRALSVEEMEAEIERMETELMHSRSNRKLLSTFDTSSSLAYSSNDLASSNDTPFPYSTPNHRQYSNSNSTSTMNSNQTDLSPHSNSTAKDELTPSTARRWSIVEVELAYERMKGMLGSTRSLGLSERTSEDDIASAFDRAIQGSERPKDSSDLSDKINALKRPEVEDEEVERLEEREPRSENVERSDSISSDASTVLFNNNNVQLRQRSYSPTPTSSPYSGRRHTEEDITAKSPSHYSNNNNNNYNSYGLKSPTMVRRSPSSRSLNILLHRQNNGVGTFEPQNNNMNLDYNHVTNAREGSISPTFNPTTTTTTIDERNGLGRKDSIETRSSLSTSNGSKTRIPLVRNLTRDSTISTTYDTASEGGWGTPRTGTLSPNDDNESVKSDSTNRESLGGANWLGDQSSVTIKDDLNRSGGGGGNSTTSSQNRTQDYRQGSIRSSESPIDRFLLPRRSLPIKLSNSSLSNVHPDSPTLDFLATLEREEEEEDEDGEGDRTNEWRSKKNINLRKKSVATIGSLSDCSSGEGNVTSSSIKLEDIRGMNESELFEKFNSLEMERDAYLYALERSKKTSSQIAKDVKDLELSSKREKDFSAVLGAEPSTQLERLTEIVQNQKLWERRANQAQEELEHARQDTNALKKALLQGLQREEDLERESVTLGAKLVAFAAAHGVLTPEPGTGRNGTMIDPLHSPLPLHNKNNGYPFPSTTPKQNGTSPRQFRSPPRNPLRPVSKSLMNPLPALPATSPGSSIPTTPISNLGPTTNSPIDYANSPSARLALAFRGALEESDGSRPSSVISLSNSELGLGELGSPLMTQELPPTSKNHNFNTAFDLKSSYGSSIILNNPIPSPRIKVGRGQPPPLLTRPSYSSARKASGASALSSTSTVESMEYSALDRRPGYNNRKETAFLSDLNS